MMDVSPTKASSSYAHTPTDIAVCGTKGRTPKSLTQVCVAQQKIVAPAYACQRAAVGSARARAAASPTGAGAAAGPARARAAAARTVVG